MKNTLDEKAKGKNKCISSNEWMRMIAINSYWFVFWLLLIRVLLMDAFFLTLIFAQLLIFDTEIVYNLMKIWWKFDRKCFEIDLRFLLLVKLIRVKVINLRKKKWIQSLFALN